MCDAGLGYSLALIQNGVALSCAHAVRASSRAWRSRARLAMNCVRSVGRSVGFYFCTCTLLYIYKMCVVHVCIDCTRAHTHRICIFGMCTPDQCESPPTCTTTTSSSSSSSSMAMPILVGQPKEAAIGGGINLAADKFGHSPVNFVDWNRHQQRCYAGILKIRHVCERVRTRTRAMRPPPPVPLLTLHTPRLQHSFAACKHSRTSRSHLRDSRNVLCLVARLVANARGMRWLCLHACTRLWRRL